MFKQAASAQALRETALKYGLIPGVGRKWKAIARKLHKMTSENFPRNGKTVEDMADEALPARQHYKNISRVDNVVSDKYPRREFSGIVDKDKADLAFIGNSHSTNGAVSLNNYDYHKHPFGTLIPSKEDLGGKNFFAKYLAEDKYLPADRVVKLKGYVYGGSHDLAGLTSYSAKYKAFKDKPGYYINKAGIDFIYKKNPKLYNLAGELKNIKAKEVDPTYSYDKMHQVEKAYMKQKGIELKAKDSLDAVAKRKKIRNDSKHLRETPTIEETKKINKKLEEIVDNRKKTLKHKRDLRSYAYASNYPKPY